MNTAKSLTCAACGESMPSIALEGTLRGPFSVDWCRLCRAFWFDAGEQFRLTPAATLTLLRTLAHDLPPARHAIGTRLFCPVCRAGLGKTHDLVGGNQVLFFRCPNKHGIFMSVADFLRSQGLVRGLSAPEMGALRNKLSTVSCSSCGAPVPTERALTCSYCGSPVSVLDTDHFVAAVRQLEADARASDASSVRGAPPAPPNLVVEAWRADRAVQASLESAGSHRRQDGGTVDLLEVGLFVLRNLFD